MQINMSKLDRILRVVVAFTFLLLFYAGTLTGTAGTIGLVLAAVLLGTVTFGYCPLYTLLGINTCPNKP
jgi:uncharacterized membrane protein HdeD (DUF308 family)